MTDRGCTGCTHVNLECDRLFNRNSSAPFRLPALSDDDHKADKVYDDCNTVTPQHCEPLVQVRLDRPESLSEVEAKCRRALSVRGLNCDVFCSPLASFVSGCQASIGRFGDAVDIKQIVHELSANASDSELPSASHQMAAALGNYLMSTEAAQRCEWRSHSTSSTDQPFRLELWRYFMARCAAPTCQGVAQNSIGGRSFEDERCMGS